MQFISIANISKSTNIPLCLEFMVWMHSVSKVSSPRPAITTSKMPTNLQYCLKLITDPGIRQSKQLRLGSFATISRLRIPRGSCSPTKSK